jgi:hypothetical protein
VNHRLVDSDWTRFHSSLLAWYAWLIWFLFLSTSPHLSFGQEAPSSPGNKESSSSQKREREAGRTGADSAGPAGDSTLGEEEAIRRDRLSQRFGQQPLAPEEEEAMRLSAIAARMGNDPTAIIGRAQTLFRYDALEGGKRTNNLVTRLDVPFQGNFVLRADMPYVWSTPNQPGADNQNGVGDLFVRGGGRVYTTPTSAVFAGMDFTFPTADKTQLGSGKYTVGPGVATAHVFPALDSLLFTLIVHQVSVGGDPSRQSISTSSGQIFFNTVWTDQWWTRLELVPQVLWEQKGKSSMTLEFEGGYRFVKDWGVWVRPGVGLWGRNIPGAYDWNIEVGIRHMFAAF